MIRARAVLRLLQHGKLTMEQIVAIGGHGWDDESTASLLAWLAAEGCIMLTGRTFRLTGTIQHALRRLHDCQQRDQRGAPAGVATVQPNVPGVRSEIHRRAAGQDLVVSEATRRAHDPGRRGLGQVRTRRAAAARRGSSNVERVGGVGS